MRLTLLLIDGAASEAVTEHRISDHRAGLCLLTIGIRDSFISHHDGCAAQP